MMGPRTRNIIQYFVYSIGGFVIGKFIYDSVSANNAENIIASVSLLIALVSMFITTLTYNQELDSKLPQVVLDADFKSRYGLVVLSIKNFGQMTAFDVEISWSKPILNCAGENIFGKGKSPFVTKLPVLQNGQELKITIDEIGSFYSKYTDRDLKYSGKVKYSLAKTRKTFIETDFLIDLSIFRNTLYHETESLKAYFELQKIPKILQGIKEQMNSSGNDNPLGRK